MMPSKGNIDVWLVMGFGLGVVLFFRGLRVFRKSLIVADTPIIPIRSVAMGLTQVHGHTGLELIWTAGPVVILAVIAAFVFYKLPGISNVPAASANDRVNVTVEGHQFYWLYRYPNGAVSINELHVPVGKLVYLTIESADVDHSFWVPELARTTDAIPGRTNSTWLETDHPGS